MGSEVDTLNKIGYKQHLIPSPPIVVGPMDIIEHDNVPQPIRD
jgi:hypothetical protein